MTTIGALAPTSKGGVDNLHKCLMKGGGGFISCIIRCPFTTGPRKDKVNYDYCIEERFYYREKIARHFVQYRGCLQTFLTFYATQLIKAFRNLRISANHDFSQS